MKVKENIKCKLLISKAGALRLTRRSGTLRRAGGNRYVIDHANHAEVLDMSYSKKPNGTLNDGTRITLNAIFNRALPDWFNTP